MAVLQISLAPTAVQSQIPTAKQDSSTFPDEMQSQMSRNDRPDPGGGPPARTANGGATKLGPNAQSNQPDLSSPSTKATQTPVAVPAETGAQAADQASTNVATAVVSALADTVGDSTEPNSPTPQAAKLSKPAQVDPTLIAMLVSNPSVATVAPSVSAVATQGSGVTATVSAPPVAKLQASQVAVSLADVTMPAPKADSLPTETPSSSNPTTHSKAAISQPTQANSASTPAAGSSVSGPKTVSSLTVSTAPATPAAPVQVPSTDSPLIPNPITTAQRPNTTEAQAAAEATTTAVVVDRAAIQATPRSLSVIPNAAVANSANGDNSTPTISDAVAVTMPQANASGQDSFGPPSGGHNSQSGQPTPDLTTAGASGVASTPAQVSATTPTQPTALPDSQRLDVVKQAADHIEMAAAARAPQGVTVHLSPQGMGDLTVVVKGVGKDIEATISASNVAVRNALSDSKDTLNEAITAKGFNLVGVSVTTHSQSTNSQNRQPSQNPQSPQDLARQTGGGNANSNSSQRGASSLSSGGLNTKVAAERETTLVSAAKDGVDYLI